ncbi:MAG: helix-turn-helix domain-containing protein [Candidatus Edwardsbacteria bacterium]
MNLTELLKIGESETVEFKKSTGEWKEIVETVSGFANTRGGIILVGVDKKGLISGCDIGKGTVEDLVNKILTNIEPKLYPEVKVETITKKKIILIKVEEYPYDVVLAFGRPYKRAGKNTLKMSKDEYKRKILEIHKKELYFDGQICDEIDFSDIDTDKVRIFLRKARETRKLDIDASLPEKEILKKLKLMKNEELMNAGVLLFAKRPEDTFIQSGVKCIRFKGTDVAGDMLDFKEIEGDLFSLVAEVEKFIFSNISLKAWIEEGKLERQEKWEYPPKAIREALVNAIIHRDYRSSGKVQVRIFDDRIEFWNPGKLPEGWTVETLKAEHTSEPFNPLIARMFFWIGLVEEVGSGTNRIVSWCKEWGLPEPEYGLSGSSLFVLFRKDIFTEKYLRELGLNERQIKAVKYVKKNGKITNKEYQELTKVSKPMATIDLRELVSKGIFEKKGVTGKGTAYIFVRANKGIKGLTKG